MSDHSPYPADKTLPLSVENTGFLLDRMGEDCHPLQFLRELTQNAIEAILRTKEKTGEVIWDVDWITYDLDDVYKLCVTDNGDGMTGPEMVRYINQLSSSVAQQSFEGNYGVGAKIAAAPRNHEGLIYISWQGGDGSMVHLWRDPETSQYGLRQLSRPDGTYGHFARVEDTVKPELIDRHGTKVMLLGNSGEADTMAAPEGAPSPSRWISKYLNTRYFRFPEGITVKAREGWMNPRSDADRNVLRTIIGQESYLAEHAKAAGTVLLTNARAHWWVLKDENALSSNSGYIESSGHVAALYNDELYEMASSSAGRALLQQFGVILGARRAVIYVEPDPDAGRLTTNTARTNLLINNTPLPWSDWASEFRDQLPEEIEALINEVAAGSSVSDHSNTIKDRLRQILDLYKLTRYRPSPTGTLMIDADRTTRGGAPKSTSTTRSGGSGRSGKKGGTAGGVYSVFLKENGEPGEEVKPDPFPEVRWVSIKDGTRDPGDMEDRAARYHPDQHLLYINADFRVFTDMVSHYCRQFGDSPAVKETVINAVQGWFQQTLMETVMGIQALQNSREWSVDNIDKAVSEEALTAAVMPRYHVNYAVRRELGSKLGKLEHAS